MRDEVNSKEKKYQEWANFYAWKRKKSDYSCFKYHLFFYSFPMRIVKISIAVIIILVALCTGVRRYAGGFSHVTLEEKMMGPYTFAYLPFTGNYSNVGPTMEKVTQALKADGIEVKLWLGIYYDNPQTVPADQLRSDVWSIIDSKDIAKLQKKSDNYLIKTIPANQNIVATFPAKNMLSYMIWPMKVYPIMAKYMTEKNYPMMTVAMELYDISNKVTYYFTKIQK